MGILKPIFIIAITMALSITLTMQVMKAQQPFVQHDLPTSQEQQPIIMFHDENNNNNNNIVLPSKRLSRLLAENPRAADHCNKDYDACYYHGAANSTCCNNKCIDVAYDHHNCGACKKKCKYPQTCCRGYCVDTNYDKRHCGRCNNRCEEGQYCVYGLCGYA